MITKATISGVVHHTVKKFEQFTLHILRVRNKVKLITSKSVNIKIDLSVFVGTQVDQYIAPKAAMQKKRKLGGDEYVCKVSEWNFRFLFAVYRELFVIVL